jgi:hypothetical protein
VWRTAGGGGSRDAAGEVDEAEAHPGEAKGSSNWLSGSLGGSRAQLPVAPSSFPAICHLDLFLEKLQFSPRSCPGHVFRS